MNEPLLALGDAEPIAAAMLNPSLCEHCSKPFAPRTGSGGKPQRFCSETCRRQFHAVASPTPPTPKDVEAPFAIQQPTAKSPTSKAPKPVADERDDFDWKDEEVVLLREQPATAIYSNLRGNVVIRQEQAWDVEDDPYVIIDPVHAIAVAKRILSVAGLGEIGFVRRVGGGFEDVA